MDRKQRDEFDSTLNSGIGDNSWARIEGRAWERLESGDFDRGSDLGEQDIGDQ
jgi:hypothetical protein